jgi:hypothetical protein
VSTVRIIGDLTVRHLGCRIRIPDLHQPGTDWDAPKVTVEGTLIGLRLATFGLVRACWVDIRPQEQLDSPLLPNHPCHIEEDQ